MVYLWLVLDTNRGRFVSGVCECLCVYIMADLKCQLRSKENESIIRK